MKTLNITALPYAVQYGTIKVPDNLDESCYTEYINDHWDDIEFEPPDLDYCGTDFEIDEE